MKPTPLTAGKMRFVEFYCADPKRNATNAYLKAFDCTRNAAGVEASRLLDDPRIQDEIARFEAGEAARQRGAAAALGLTQDLVTQHLFEIVTADPRDLIEFRRGACRWCYGEGHLYQSTARELRDAYRHYLTTPAGKADSAGFDMQGGDGFNPKRDPHPACPECFGEGVGYEFVKDTRKLSPAAARLYAGMKITKEGIEIKTRGQDKLLNLAMQHLGMLNERIDDGATAEAKAAEVRALVAALGATVGKSE